MVVIRLFNDREQTVVPVIYGCVTSGSNWRFPKLDGSTLSIDITDYYLHGHSKILGILVGLIRG